MKIKISAEKHGITFIIPTKLLFSNMILSHANEGEQRLSRSARKNIYLALKKSIEINGHFTLVEATSSDGESVKITV